MPKIAKTRNVNCIFPVSAGSRHVLDEGVDGDLLLRRPLPDVAGDELALRGRPSGAVDAQQDGLS